SPVAPACRATDNRRQSHHVTPAARTAPAAWGQLPPEPQAYPDRLKVAYTRATQADPTSIVLLAGMAPNLEREGSALALNDLTYLEKLYEAGASPYFDAVAVHTYVLIAAPDDPSVPDTLNFALATQL